MTDVTEVRLRTLRNELRSMAEDCERAKEALRLEREERRQVEEALRVECALRVEVEQELHNTQSRAGGLEDTLDEVEGERLELARQLAELKERRQLVMSLLPVQLDHERRINALEKWQWECEPDEWAYQHSGYGRGQEPDRVIAGLDTEIPELQRDEARAVARDLLSRCLSLANSDPGRVGQMGGFDLESGWIERYPWLEDSDCSPP